MNKKVYWGLSVGAVVALGLSLAFGAQAWLSNLLLNLGANVIGILVVLIFVERIVRSDNDRNRKRVERGALRKTGQSIQQIVRAFSNLLKGSLLAPPVTPPETVADLFAEAHIQSLDKCDFGAAHVAPSSRGWPEYMNDVLYRSLGELSSVIAAYGAFVQPEYLELLDELCDHVYIEYVRSMYPYIEHERARGVQHAFPLDGRPEDRRNFFNLLVKLVELHNTIGERRIGVPASFASPSYAPSWGELSIDATTRKVVQPPQQIQAADAGLPTAPPPPRLMLLDP